MQWIAPENNGGLTEEEVELTDGGYLSDIPHRFQGSLYRLGNCRTRVLELKTFGEFVRYYGGRWDWE